MKHKVSAIIFLPLILVGSAVAQPATFEARSLPGVTLHFEETDMITDSGGQIFISTRASREVGTIVWTVDENGQNPREILRPKKITAGHINPNFRGVCSLIIVDETTNKVQAIPIPECDV